MLSLPYVSLAMPEAISKRTAQLLKDITGEPRIDQAVLITLSDALEHRLQSVEAGLADLRERYGMDFEAFKAAWEDGQIDDRHSLAVEEDYWRWEELVTRRDRIQEAMAWLP